MNLIKIVILSISSVIIVAACADEVQVVAKKLEITVGEVIFSNRDSIKVSNVPLKIDPVSGDTEPAGAAPTEKKIYLYVPVGYEVTIIPLKQSEPCKPNQ